MSDDQIPAWAQEMENRLIEHEMNCLGTLYNHLDSFRAEMTRRFDQTRDANLDRNELAHTKIDTNREEVANLRREVSMLHRRLRELEHWRDHRPEAGS